MRTIQWILPLVLAGSALGQAPGGVDRTIGYRGNLADAVEQALDRPITLKIDNENILTAFEDITEATGVRFVIDADTLERLPYGEQTKLTAEFDNAMLRDALRTLLGLVGLTYEVHGDAVHVIATEPLKRIVRRATWDELDLLHTLNTTPWKPAMLDELSFQFQQSSRDELSSLTGEVGAGSAAEVLELACAKKGLTWYPSGKTIVVLNKQRQIERQLDKRVTLRFFHAPISDVLLDLARSADLLLKMEPGVIAALPAQIAQRFSLTIENTSIQQALEAISGTTGLSFEVQADGLHVMANPFSPEQSGGNDTGAQAAIQALRENPVIGMVTEKGTAGGADVTFFVRLGDLPEELQDAYHSKLEHAIAAMREALAK